MKTMKLAVGHQNKADSFDSPVAGLMKTNYRLCSNFRICTLLLALVMGAARLYASAFQNLDFEMATVKPAPAGYTPWDAAQPISAADALPYWTVREDSTICTAVWGAPNALDETSVALVYGNSNHALQGLYSVQLYAWAGAPSGYFQTASISQTGVIPTGMNSIQFLVQSPPVGGGFIQANPALTLNGTPINLFPISATDGVMAMAGDIRAFAGTTADLTIRCAGTSGAPFNLSENIFELDAISFSTTVVPEPNTTSLIFLASLLAGLARVRKGRKPSPIHAAK